MKCPTCPDSTLLISERQGIEIDHCPTCRGVWLDRGELDKLIQLSSGQAPSGEVAVPTAVAADAVDFVAAGEIAALKAEQARLAAEVAALRALVARMASELGIDPA